MIPSNILTSLVFICFITTLLGMNYWLQIRVHFAFIAFSLRSLKFYCLFYEFFFWYKDSMSVNLFATRVFFADQIKMRSYWMRTLNPMAGCPCEKRNLDTETETSREYHVKTEAEIRVLHCKPRGTKDCRQPPEAGRGQEGFSPGRFRTSTALQTPGFVTSSF